MRCTSKKYREPTSAKMNYGNFTSKNSAILTSEKLKSDNLASKDRDFLLVEIA